MPVNQGHQIYQMDRWFEIAESMLVLFHIRYLMINFKVTALKTFEVALDF